MRVINIVDSGEAINYGVWRSAISLSEILKKDFSIESELWIPKIKGKDLIQEFQLEKVIVVPFRIGELNRMIKLRKIDARNSIICSHSTWSYATFWSYRLKMKGFKWIAVPHGMLEPWQLEQKRLKKWIYLNLIEKRLLKAADLIRASGIPEKENLKGIFKDNQIVQIPNGTKVLKPSEIVKQKNPLIFLFLSRLHKKKGIFELVKAWSMSKLNGKDNFKLVIAGPDQGELTKINSIISDSKNIEYIGPVYGEKKEKLLKDASYFVLPSYSEGFPSAVVEAMGFGAVAVISDGCNFPEAIKGQVAIHITNEISDIRKKLDYLGSIKNLDYQQLHEKSLNFTSKYYSLEHISSQWSDVYNFLMKNDKQG